MQKSYEGKLTIIWTSTDLAYLRPSRCDCYILLQTTPFPFLPYSIHPNFISESGSMVQWHRPLGWKEYFVDTGMNFDLLVVLWQAYP